MKGVKRSGGEVQTTCPRCMKEKLYVSTRKRLGYCFYCGRGFSQKEIATLGLEDEYLSFSAFVGRKDSQVELVHPDTDPAARLYLANRRVKAKNCGSFILYAPSLQRLFFRIWSPDHISYAPAYHTRSIEPGKGWMCSPGVQKQHYWFGHRGGEVIVLCEGIFDALSLHQRGVCAIALLGTQMSDTQLRGLLEWEPLKQVVVWLDDDEAGRKASDQICTQLEPVVPTVVQVIEYPEPSESDEVPEECYALAGNR